MACIVIWVMDDVKHDGYLNGSRAVKQAIELRLRERKGRPARRRRLSVRRCLSVSAGRAVGRCLSVCLYIPVSVRAQPR